MMVSKFVGIIIPMKAAKKTPVGGTRERFKEKGGLRSSLILYLARRGGLAGDKKIPDEDIPRKTKELRAEAKRESDSKKNPKKVEDREQVQAPRKPPRTKGKGWVKKGAPARTGGAAP